jgi:hypothetical protein
MLWEKNQARQVASYLPRLMRATCPDAPLPYCNGFSTPYHTLKVGIDPNELMTQLSCQYRLGTTKSPPILNRFDAAPPCRIAAHRGYVGGGGEVLGKDGGGSVGLVVKEGLYHGGRCNLDWGNMIEQHVSWLMVKKRPLPSFCPTAERKGK